MKKMMFSALACVAFAFSGFASNEVVNETDFDCEKFVWCRIQVSILDEDGNKTIDVRNDSSTTKIYNDCLNRSNEFVKSLEMEGLNVGSVI